MAVVGDIIFLLLGSTTQDLEKGTEEFSTTGSKSKTKVIVSRTKKPHWIQTNKQTNNP